MTPTYPGHDTLSVSERPGTKRGTFRRGVSMGTALTDTLSVSERAPRKKLSQRVSKFMRGKSGGAKE